MRILFLTQWFQPEPFIKGLPFAKALQDRGHEIEVLTGFPNYPGGKIYNGYKIRLYKRELMDGIRVNRVALYPSHDKSAFRRILNYISFSLSAYLLGPLLIKKPDIIYVYNLVTLGPPAFLFRFLFGAKVLMDVQDLWPESVVNSKMLQNRIVLATLGMICNGVYSKADALAVLSPGFKDELMGRGLNPQKIKIIYNWCDESSMRESVPSDGGETPESDGIFTILFAGTMGTAQALDAVLDCAVICRKEDMPIRFVFIGGGVDRSRLERKARDSKLENVSFLPPRPMNEMDEVFASADALIIHLKDDPLFRITIPSKTQAYLLAGKPIIMAVRGDAANLIREAEAGILCQPEDSGSIFKAIKSLYEMTAIERRNMGEAGRSYYLKFLSFREGVDRFERIMISSSGKTV
jgi:colanic acid biosynthesis glycosyl transferase WcaI